MAHAVAEKQKLLNRVRRLRGQVDAIERALIADEELRRRDADSHGHARCDQLESWPKSSMGTFKRIWSMRTARPQKLNVMPRSN